jgi:hypothetical protein
MIFDNNLDIGIFFLKMPFPLISVNTFLIQQIFLNFIYANFRLCVFVLPFIRLRRFGEIRSAKTSEYPA